MAMLHQESDGYDAVQDKEILLSEEGASFPVGSDRSRPLWQKVGGVLILGGTAVAATVAVFARTSSRSLPAARVSSKVGLQAYGYDPVAYQAPAATYGQAPGYDQQYGYAAPQYAAPQYAADPYAQAAAAPAAVPAAVPAAAAWPPPPTGEECGGAGDNCLGSQCCKDPGFQCFSKNHGYGTCRAVCEAGMTEEGEPWDCEPLGEPAPVPDGPEKCSWSGENCIALKCCNDANMKCFQKDGYFAGCKFKPPEGWDNTVIGEFRGWHQAYSGGAGGDKLGTKLYCIAVKSPNARVDEGALLQAAEALQIGIYSCNENSIFDGAAAARTEWKSISNTDIFINVWNQVKAEGKFWNNDWTIKADPDCVFFGQRLGQHLEKLNIGKEDAVYIKNCDFKFRFQGSLEVFSNKAMEKYYKYAGMCSDKIGHEGGEDFFMMTCMDAMGVEAVEDDSILYDKYATQEHLILDDVSSCSNGWTAAFHPFRTVEVWNDCANTALQAEQKK